MNRFLVLLSGGLDSVVNLYEAHRRGRVELALTFDYGQRAAQKEIAAAGYFCAHLGVKHKVIVLDWLRDITKTALVNEAEVLPQLKDLDDLKEGNQTAKAVWVPNRNGIFLNAAAAFAEALGIPVIVPGFNKEEAATFPDNSKEYLAAVNASLALSTLSQVKTVCFTTAMTKTEMVRMALELGVEMDRLWSCYRAGEKPCGVCESCQRTLRALEAVGR